MHYLNYNNKLFLILLILFLISLFIRLSYPIERNIYYNGFKLDVNMMDKWAIAESSNNPSAISKKQAYGLFQIKKCMLEDYCRYTKQDISKIKDYKSFLLNETNNIYITCFMIAFFRRYGFSYEEIAQIWLYGLYGVYENKNWSYSYQYKIFGHKRMKVLNWVSYFTIIGREELSYK